MGNYISVLKVRDGNQEWVAELAYPRTPRDPGTLNVLCGPNGGGKSQLLRIVNSVLRHPERQASHPDISVEWVGASRPVPQLAGSLWREKTRMSKIDLGGKHGKLNLPHDVLDSRRASLRFVLRQLKEHVPHLAELTESRWLEDKDVRVDALGFLENENDACLCSRSDPVVQLLEESLDGTLYLRKTEIGDKSNPETTRGQASSPHHPQFHLEFVLAHPGGILVPFDMWSDGQKVLLYLTLMMQMEKPEVILLDEIENHLHPANISKVMLALRKSGSQCLLTTHNPHVMFSDFCDRVFYLDSPSLGKERNPQTRLTYSKQLSQKPRRSGIIELHDGFEKIVGLYQMFDKQDNQLLRHAQLIYHQAEVDFYRFVAGALVSEVLPESKRPLPDSQTRGIAEEIRTVADRLEDSRPVRVLDFGAGIGRVAAELSKGIGWSKMNQDWFAWEPDEERREVLRSRLAGIPLTSTIVDSLCEIAESSVDVCILANVLHELCLEAATRALLEILVKLNRNSGVIIVAEIYPLLKPERFAIPYSGEALRRIFNRIGLKSVSSSLPIRSSTVVLSTVIVRFVPNQQLPELNTIRSAIEEEWVMIEQAAVSSYSARDRIRSFDNYGTMVQELMTLASIAANKHGQWN